MMAKFSDVLTIINGKNQSKVENPNGKYPIYGSGGVMGRADDYICEADTIVIGRKGSINKPIYVDEPFWNVDTAFGLQADKTKLLPKYLFYFCLNFDFEKLNTTVTIPSLTKANLLQVSIPLPDLPTQQRIADTLDKVSEGIEVCRKMLGELDLMVKAKFGEMFGDPTGNSFNLSVKPMTEVCEIIDGDRGKNYPNADEFSDEGYCLFLNAKNVTASGFNFDNCMYITKEKDDILRKGKLSRGDVVLTTRGTIGNLAFYTSDIPYEHVRINSGMVILRMNQKIINEVFFIEQFKMLLDDIKQKIASGSAQPQLPISAMREINLLLPDIEQQKIFSEFVAKSNKSRLTLQQVLSKMELERKVLMQKYFG